MNFYFDVGLIHSTFIPVCSYNIGVALGMAGR